MRDSQRKVLIALRPLGEWELLQGRNAFFVRAPTREIYVFPTLKEAEAFLLTQFYLDLDEQLKAQFGRV